MERLREGVVFAFSVLGVIVMTRMTLNLFVNFIDWTIISKSSTVAVISLLYAYWAYFIPHWSKKIRNNEN